MRESGYYPEGTEYSSDAPWNQKSLPEEKFEVTISQTLSKNTTVHTDDYIPGEVYPEVEYDDGGCCTVTCKEPNDTSETDWKKAYNEEHRTPLYLIQLFKHLLEGSIDLGDIHISRRAYLIKECSDWVEDDLEVCED